MDKEVVKNNLTNLIIIGLIFKIFSYHILYAATTKIKPAQSFNHNPYIGVSLGINHLKFKKDYGDNLFTKKLRTSNILLGINFTPYLGIESGYEKNIYSEKSVVISRPEKYLGEYYYGVANGESMGCFTNTKVTGIHLGIIYTYPRINIKNYINNLHLINYIGVKNTKVKLKSRIHTIASATVNIEDHLNRHSNKLLLRLAVGLNYLTPWKHLNCRAAALFENSSRLKPSTQRQTLQARLKDSLGIQIGAIFNI